MKTTYCTWTKVGNSLKIVRRASNLQDAYKGFRPSTPIVTCKVNKS